MRKRIHSQSQLKTVKYLKVTFLRMHRILMSEGHKTRSKTIERYYYVPGWKELLL